SDISTIIYFEIRAYSPLDEPIFLATKLLEAGSMLQFVNFSITIGLASESKKFLTRTSKVILLNDRLAIETFGIYPFSLHTVSLWTITQSGCKRED
ncbi:MAG: hypothetical protein ACK55Z_27925, partial [bacterium]